MVRTGLLHVHLALGSVRATWHIDFGIDDDGHRPIIDQANPHMRAEPTFFDRHSPGA